MIPLRASLVAALAFSLAPSLAMAAEAAAFPYDQFAPSVIGTIAADAEALNLPGTDKKIMYMATVTKVRVTVTYVGISRPLTPDESGMISHFAQGAPGSPKGYADLYKESYAFDDAGRRYWLPVQNQVAAYFGKELKVGQRIQVFAVLAGGLAEKDRPLEPVLLVQEFNGEIPQGH
jgi:hypothetical protein